MRDVYRITGNYYLSIITLFRSDSSGRFELTSILLSSMTLAKRTTKCSQRPRGLQKLQVMSEVLGADPVFVCLCCWSSMCFLVPLSLGSHLTPSGSRVRDFIQCQDKGCTAQLPPYGSRVEISVGSFFCRDVGAGEPWAKWGCCEISEISLWSWCASSLFIISLS